MATRKSPGPMHSRAQWRFLFAKHGNRGFVKRWARAIEYTRGKHAGFDSLPPRVGARKR
jgi:hypothetical protein